MGKIPGPGRLVEISDSIELCIVELTRVDCSPIEKKFAPVEGWAKMKVSFSPGTYV